MTTQLTARFAYDLMRDTLSDDDPALRILAEVERMCTAEAAAQQIAEVLALGAAGTRTYDPPPTTTADVILVFSTQACSVQLASAGTSISIAAGGYLLLQGVSLAYLKVTMGATAGTVAVFLAK